MIINRLKTIFNVRKISLKIIKDIFINGLASGVITLVLQLAVYPLLAIYFSTSDYGSLLLQIGIANIIVVSIGNSLNNVRIIQNTLYDEKKVTGDYNVIVSFSSILFGVFAFALCVLLFRMDIVTCVFFIGYVMLGIARVYYTSAYWITLNLKGLLLCNAITASGYLAGLFLLYVTDIWTIVFFTGEAITIVFLYFNVKLTKEPFRKTSLFKITITKFVLIIATSVIGNIIVYLDRLIIYPLLGSSEVSIYVVSSFFGKGLAIFVMPISTLFLGYFSQADFSMSRRRFHLITIGAIIACAIFAMLSMLISKWITGIFYPTLINEASSYIFIANLSAIVFISTSLLQPVILKFAPTTWLPPIQIAYAILFFGFGYLGIQHSSLMGYCYAILIANIIYFIILFFAGERALSRLSCN